MSPELENWVLQLAERDWRRAGEACRALADSGEAGVAAAMEGMKHPDPRVRRACTGFMNHYGTDAAIPALLAALHDEVPRVRREAVHSLSCDRCKESPLCLDTLALLLSIIEEETNARVRREAVYFVGIRPPDTRAIPVLKAVLADIAIPKPLRQAAHQALRHHDPDYRRWTDAEARARSITAHGTAP